MKEELVLNPDFRIMFDYSLPALDVSTTAALSNYGTVLTAANPHLQTMFQSTKKELLNSLFMYSIPITYDSDTYLQSLEEELALQTSDPVDASGDDLQAIMQASYAILRTIAEMTDPTVATAKAIKDLTYQGYRAAMGATVALAGGDPKTNAKAFYGVGGGAIAKTVRYWRSSRSMFPLIPSLLPYPLIPAEFLYSMGIFKPFNITPIGMAYWALSPFGLLDPLDNTLGSFSDRGDSC